MESATGRIYFMFGGRPQSGIDYYVVAESRRRNAISHSPEIRVGAIHKAFLIYQASVKRSALEGEAPAEPFRQLR
jgi:hypothetical protein